LTAEKIEVAIFWVVVQYQRFGGLCRLHLRSEVNCAGRGGIRGCIQKFPVWVSNEIYAYNNKHSFRRNIKGYGGKTHYIDSQNSDPTAPNGTELYHLQFSLQAASPEPFGYTLVDVSNKFVSELRPATNRKRERTVIIALSTKVKVKLSLYFNLSTTS
jgi:hypothetical protein